MSSKRILTLTSLAVLLAVLPLSAQILKQSDLKRIYGSRWIVLPLPDSRISPGAIVSIKKGQVAWESNLSSCGAPANVLEAVPGQGGQVSLNREAEYSANAVLGIKGVKVGPEFKNVKKTTLKVEEHKPEGLDRIKLGTWFKDPGTKLSAACSGFLTQDNIFIVQEAYRVNHGKFTLFDDNNKKISLSGLTLGLLSLEGSAGAKTTETGDLEFTQPVYTAIRRLKLMKDNELRTLGAPGEEKTDDARARAILEGTSAPSSKR